MYNFCAYLASSADFSSLLIVRNFDFFLSVFLDSLEI